MAGKIITSVLTGIGAYAVIKYAYEKGHDKGISDLWDYFETTDQEDFEKVFSAIQRHRERNLKTVEKN